MKKQSVLFCLPALLLGATMTCAAVTPEISIEHTSGKVVAWGRYYNGPGGEPPGLDSVRAVAGGLYHAVALKSDGTVVAWGSSEFGQTNVPAGLSGVSAIAAGFGHTVALRSDGTVVGWGSPTGQSGMPGGLAGVVAIAAGGNHTVALKSDGTVVAWGSNENGQTNVPAGLSGVQAIAAGGSHTIALKADGTVVAWGRKHEGQATVPAQLTGVRAVAAGALHSVALKLDGTVTTWGSNEYGHRTVPPGLKGVEAISAGLYFTLAPKNNGTVVHWGDNNDGEANVPVGLQGVQAIASGGYFAVALVGATARFGTNSIGSAGLERIFTIKNSGSGPVTISGVTVVGPQAADFTVNTEGMLSTLPATHGQTTCRVTFRAQADGDRKATLRVLSDDSDEGTYEIALAGTGSTPKITVYTGDNTDAENERVDNFGIYTFAKGRPAQIFTIKNYGSIEVTGLKLVKSGANPDRFMVSGPEVPILAPGAVTTFTVAFGSSDPGTQSAVVSVVNGDSGESGFRINLSASGASPEINIGYPCCSVVAWGDNTYGQSDVPEGLTGVQAIAAGHSHTVALRSDGTVISWGTYSVGPDFGTPISGPIGLTGVQAVAARANYSLALRNDGTLVSWGFNLNGLGNLPPGLTNAQSIALGGDHGLAVRADGTVVGWGWNVPGGPNVPVGLTEVKAIAAGAFHSLALKRDGTVVAWGGNSSVEGRSPGGLTGVRAIAAGRYHNLALKADGTVVAWGQNDAGQVSVPVGLAGVQAITAGRKHSVALKADGTIVAWGLVTGKVPSGLASVRAVAAGDWHTVALVESASSKIAFGAQTVGSASAGRILEIKNSGTGPLHIAQVSIVGAHASDFLVSTNGLLASVPPVGGITTLTVTFRPGALGARNATLRVVNNDDDEGVYDLDLSGTGLESTVTPLSINPSSLSVLPDGTFQFTTINSAKFRVFATTNLGLPVGASTLMDAITDLGGGVRRFADPAAINHPIRFYQLRSP